MAPADPAAMRGIQQALNATHDAWQDSPDPAPRVNATCPTCGADAEHVAQDLADAHLRQETWRCLADGPRCQPTVKHSEIPAREEPAPMMSDRGPDEDLTPVPPPAPLCPCGCKGTPRAGRRFADRSCALRWNKANGVFGGRKKKSSPAPAGDSAPTLPDRTPAGVGNTTPPPAAKLCDCGCGRPCLGTRRWATAECRPEPSGLSAAKSYLRKLTPEGRQALLDLVAAEERCRALGVA